MNIKTNLENRQAQVALNAMITSTGQPVCLIMIKPHSLLMENI
jgi:hypothetical protein